MSLSLPELCIPSPVEKIYHPLLKEKNILLFAKRDDKIHHDFSGNKYRKLKFNLIQFQEKGFSFLITFGGAYSNHLHAVSFLSKYYNIITVGIVRGEPEYARNTTLSECLENGMSLHFVSREEYRLKEKSSDVQKILSLYPNHFLIPEGGSNTFALPGVCEIWNELSIQLRQVPDYIFCASGTGATAAGLLSGVPEKTRILAFPVLKYDHFEKEILSFSNTLPKENLLCKSEYHFGGYARRDKNLIDFVKEFTTITDIEIDLVYNAKALYGFFDLVKHDFFQKNSRIVWLNTGGLQGNKGLNPH